VLARLVEIRGRCPQPAAGRSRRPRRPRVRGWAGVDRRRLGAAGDVYPVCQGTV